MKVAVGVLCWNQFDNDRVALFDESYESIRRAAPDLLVVADNGSADGTAGKVAELPEGILFPTVAGSPHGNTCGYGMNKLAATLAQTDADIIVLSNDDIVWAEDAFDRLRKLWATVDESFKILSGLVEPTFALPGKSPWNEVHGVLDVEGEDVWVRASAPGGAWSYRREDTGLIFPVSTFPGVDDVPACKRLAEAGFAVGAVDVATHAGVGKSSWGNASHERFLVETVEEMREQWISS